MTAVVMEGDVSIARTQFTICNPQGTAQPSPQTRIARTCPPLGMPVQQRMKFGQYERSVFITAHEIVCWEFSHIKQAQSSHGLVNTMQT